MSTELLEAPAPAVTRSDKPAFHWVCVQAADEPYIGLCGHLTGGKRSFTLKGVCQECMTLAVGHSATCPQCARWLPRGA